MLAPCLDRARYVSDAFVSVLQRLLGGDRLMAAAVAHLMTMPSQTKMKSRHRTCRTSSGSVLPSRARRTACIPPASPIKLTISSHGLSAGVLHAPCRNQSTTCKQQSRSCAVATATGFGACAGLAFVLHFSGAAGSASLRCKPCCMCRTGFRAGHHLLCAGEAGIWGRVIAVALVLRGRLCGDCSRC